jgi:hypothetical protein
MTETNEQLLLRLAKTNKSTEQDSYAMEVLLKRIGFEKARVVSGIAYLEGKGTLNAPPTSIHSVARMLIAGYKKHGVM